MIVVLNTDADSSVGLRHGSRSRGHSIKLSKHRSVPSVLFLNDTRTRMTLLELTRLTR